MKSNQFGVHEITDLRELSNFKWACLTQLETQLLQVQNPVLKQLLIESAEQDKLTITNMQPFLVSASESFMHGEGSM
ncbi:hypothetical protein [Terribacillus saccharophilus]|uniref:hypothetical protein n=1 Tax=Terribacillus saccharophilus TaxID=361277 RepID=UPI003982CADC